MNGIFHGCTSTLGIKMIESTTCVKENGTRPEVVKRTWKERLFTKPFNFWVSTKIIQVPNYEPAMYLYGDSLVYHPALRASLDKEISKYNNMSSF
jgi:hypothetical protein